MSSQLIFVLRCAWIEKCKIVNYSLFFFGRRFHQTYRGKITLQIETKTCWKFRFCVIYFFVSLYIDSNTRTLFSYRRIKSIWLDRVRINLDFKVISTNQTTLQNSNRIYKLIQANSVFFLFDFFGSAGADYIQKYTNIFSLNVYSVCVSCYVSHTSNRFSSVQRHYCLCVD